MINPFEPSVFKAVFIAWPNSPGFNTSGSLIAWITGQILFFLKVRNEDERDNERRNKFFRDYIIASLQGDFETARHKLDRVLEMDAEDVDALFHLYQVLKASGDTSGAKKILKKCRDLDEEEKWKWELQETT